MKRFARPGLILAGAVALLVPVYANLHWQGQLPWSPYPFYYWFVSTAEGSIDTLLIMVAVPMLFLICSRHLFRGEKRGTSRALVLIFAAVNAVWLGMLALGSLLGGAETGIPAEVAWDAALAGGFMAILLEIDERNQAHPTFARSLLFMWVLSCWFVWAAFPLGMIWI